MEVVFYQIFIAATIVATNFFKREGLLLVCGIWSFFTLANLFFPPLIFVQLGVIWGTYFLLKNSDGKSRRITELEELTSALPEGVKAQVEIVSTDYKQLLSGVEHYSYMRSAIQSSTKSVTILSGWLSARVVDREFVKLLREKLEEGVFFRIGYGWQDSQGAHKAGNDLDKALSELRKLANDFPNQLKVAEYATHEKMLVIDGKTVVFGSANWLSNRQYKNSERSIVVIDVAIAESEEHRISELVQENRVI
ncbi:phospholipase D-like domain-containing protein [Pseudomonadales bacterium]|nr:phospholipase D-like domain-containing protein [Pseudomonadales bacterium]